MISLADTFRIPAPRDRVYAALRDPDILRSCIEGCERLTEVEPGVYDAELRLGLGGIRGRYTGRTRVTAEDPPNALTLAVEGKGAGSHVRGEGRLQLLEAADGTDVKCEATGQAGGALAAVGSRLLQAAAARLMSQFFATLTTELAARR
jgi:carbon monoxide dehydrogenase subunit G